MALPCAAADSRVLIKKKEIRKRGNCECIATWGRPTPRQFFSALIMTSCQVKSLNLFITILWRLCCWYITWPRDLDLWLWTFAMYHLWRDETLYQIWTQSSNSRRSYCDFNIWPNDLKRRVTVALGSGIIFTKVWPSTTYSCLSYSNFMLIRHVTLWPWPLSSWPCTFTALRVSCI